jgi:hypothetical protein
MDLKELHGDWIHLAHDNRDLGQAPLNTVIYLEVT